MRMSKSSIYASNEKVIEEIQKRFKLIKGINNIKGLSFLDKKEVVKFIVK
jgi:hypothetical protein